MQGLQFGADGPSRGIAVPEMPLGAGWRHLERGDRFSNGCPLPNGVTTLIKGRSLAMVNVPYFATVIRQENLAADPE